MVRTLDTTSDWQIAILGAVDHQIEDRRVKKRPDFIKYNKSTAIICALSFRDRNYITLLLFVYFTVLR